MGFWSQCCLLYLRCEFELRDKNQEWKGRLAPETLLMTRNSNGKEGKSYQKCTYGCRYLLAALLCTFVV